MKYLAGMAVLVLGFFLLLGCTTPVICGNGICETGESSNSCITDCGLPTAQQAISNGLASVSKGGMVTTQGFVLYSGDTLNSKQFEGFDPHSINFEVDSTMADAGFERIDAYDYSGFIYNGAGKISASAKVICEMTGTSLMQTLEDAGVEGAFGVNVTDLCEPDEEGQYQPCCIVILQRS